MPRVVPKLRGRRPFRKGERVRAVEAAYVEHEGESFYVRTGMEFDADHPVVKAIPDSFMPSDTPADQVSAWLPPPPEPVEHPSEFPGVHRPQRQVADERAVVCIQPIITLTRQAKLGQVYDVGDEIVRMAPGSFSWLRVVTERDVEDARDS